MRDCLAERSFRMRVSLQARPAWSLLEAGGTPAQEKGLIKAEGADLTRCPTALSSRAGAVFKEKL